MFFFICKSALVHLQAVCGDVLVSVVIQDFFFFYQQHANTNATTVFKAKCDVYYLEIIFFSCIDYEANSPPFFLL